MSGQRALILISVDLTIFTELLSKTAVQLLLQACLIEDIYPDARCLKLLYFVANGDKEGIGRCVVA